MGFTHFKGVSLSNLVSSAGTIGTQTVTTVAATTVSAPTLNGTTITKGVTVYGSTKLSSPAINASTDFNLKSLVVKASKGASTYASLSDGSGFVPAVGDTVRRAYQWKFSDAVLKSCSMVTATVKVRATGVLSVAAPMLSGSVLFVDLLDKT